MNVNGLFTVIPLLKIGCSIYLFWFDKMQTVKKGHFTSFAHILSALPACLKDAECFISSRSGSIWFSSSLTLPHVSVKTIPFTVYFLPLDFAIFFSLISTPVVFSPALERKDLEREREKWRRRKRWQYCKRRMLERREAHGSGRRLLSGERRGSIDSERWASG